MNFFCIHGSRVQIKQEIAVKCLFCKILQRKCWNCYLLRNLVAHPMIFFANFCDKNWTFYRRNRPQSGQKSHSTSIFSDFLNREHTQLPNLQQLQYVNNTYWKFQTNRTNTLFVVWVRVYRRRIYISSQSNAAWNWLIFIDGDKSAIFSSSSTLSSLISHMIIR